MLEEQILIIKEWGVVDMISITTKYDSWLIGNGENSLQPSCTPPQWICKAEDLGVNRNLPHQLAFCPQPTRFKSMKINCISP